LAVAIALVAVSSCSAIGERRDRDVLDRQYDRFVRLALALGQRDPDSLDFYAGPDDWLRDARRAYIPLAEIRRSAEALAAELGRPYHAYAAETRRTFLVGELRAVVARVDVLGGARLTFDEESRRLFGVDAGERDPSHFEQVRRQLDTLLPGPGTLASRYVAFERRFIVRPDQVRSLMSRAVDACRRITVEHLPLPPGEQVEIAYVHDTPWSAFTRYEGHGRSRTEVNLDFALTVDRLLELACHETYPGHHAINVIRDAPVQLMFSPSALRTEGAATFAVDLAFPGGRRADADRDLFTQAGLSPSDVDGYLRIERLVDELRWIQVDVARRYLDGRLEFERAASVLENEALMPDSAAEATLKFFNQYRTYAVTYTVGRDRAAAAVDAGDDRGHKWRAYERWIKP
jgi:hypothetical protein